MSSPLPPVPGAETLDGEPEAGAALLAACDVRLVRAPNPGPLTLTGTNTWVVGRAPAWVIDPGPLIDAHLARLGDEIESRGGLGGVVLTHDHHDHSEAVGELRRRHPAPLAAGRGEVDLLLADGERVGPFVAVATPGHAIDHFALLYGRACFTGDAVLGSGSVFISPHAGALRGYLTALERLGAREEIEVICPGHGPLVSEPRAKLAEYVGHRLDREQRLLVALGEGRRTVEELLDAAWRDVPAQLRPAAAVTLAAHLDKLAEDQALPPGVERQDFGEIQW